MSSLELSNVTKKFGTQETLKGIDLSLESGEFLVLLGASGCGKSTLLNLISGLLDPSSGSITLEGRVLNGTHPKDRDIAMVFQSYALYPNLTVGRNIGFGLEMRNVPKAEREKAVLDAAKVLQIDHLLDRKPSDLSGGQRQRVAIGRALVRKPKLFLFDEPLSNLDAKLRMEMRGELKRLHQMLGVTIVYVTHDQIEAMTLATRVAVMRDGHIEQLGTPEEIYNRPATTFVADFMGSPPINMFKGQHLPETRLIELELADTPIALDEAVLSACAQDIPAKVIMGIRPEAFGLEPIQGGISIDCVVEIVELTGPEKIVSLDVRGQRVIATFKPEQNFKPGDRVTLHASKDKISIFDAETGKCWA
ncbi:ABC transporter ATP-binding protein [uncultured Cohaesibacter sp.]|uniref:ABC transporter ATP-binding protein n=1 Tax=uncultured Cohaesibacter sp. TaxID=1002546 RepID=UPI0029C6BA32|nr:ABC transporter ATP-binding protein [uncultured Cohaesibacter sp.]